MKIIWLLAFISNLWLRSHAQLVEKNECATSVHAIIARGQGGGDDLNVMSTLSDLILEQIPGSTTLGLPYDHGNVLTDEAKRLTVHDCAVLMQEFVREYVASCPKAKIVVVGYSMGAVAMMDAICGTSEIGFIDVAPLEPFYTKTIVSVIAYGDETYDPGMPWNVGNCILGIGLTPRMNSAMCAPYGDSIHSYCDYGDNQCCSPYPEDGNAAHHGYVKKYNQDVVAFIKKRLAIVGAQSHARN